MDIFREAVCRAVDKEIPTLNKISRELWENPELAYQEYAAHDLLTDTLDSYGFIVEKHYKLDTAFRGIFQREQGGTSSPTVAILCEYDALPGIGHGCGHNLIAECGIATAIAVKAAMVGSAGVSGKLVVMGTPAEETDGGKIDLINAGAFDDIDVVLMAHPAPYTVASPRYVSLTQLSVEYQGIESHSSSQPWDGVNALDAAVLCYQNVSCLRQQMKPEWRLSGIIENGGVAPNVIPGVTKLIYEFRTPTEPEFVILKTKVIKCIEAAAMATGCNVKYKFAKNSFQSLVHNDALVATFVKAADLLRIDIITDNMVLDKLPRASTDAGNVSHVVATLHPLFDMGTKASFHTESFCVDAGGDRAQTATLRIAKALALTAVEVMSNPDLMKDVKCGFQADVQREAEQSSVP